MFAPVLETGPGCYSAAMTLQDNSYISLMTFRRSGAEVKTPVWFASMDDHIHYCFSAAAAGKVKRLRNSSNARIATCDARGGSPGEWISCNAYLVQDENEINKAYELLVVKYGWQMRMTNFFSRLSGRISNRAIIRIEVK